MKCGRTFDVIFLLNKEQEDCLSLYIYLICNYDLVREYFECMLLLLWGVNEKQRINYTQVDDISSQTYFFDANREIVGYGITGKHEYFDLVMFPCSNISRKVDISEIVALRWTLIRLADFIFAYDAQRRVYMYCRMMNATI